jgi:hypothetical protein
MAGLVVGMTAERSVQVESLAANALYCLPAAVLTAASIKYRVKAR